MKKLINKPEDFGRETIEGIILAHPESLKMVNGNFRCLVRADEKKKSKVAISTGGGAGHLPVFLGYVGYGLADGVTVGNVFTSPAFADMYEVGMAIDNGAGVLQLYGNYGGDKMNFAMAAEMLDMEDIRVTEVRGTDDVASAPKGEEDKRRGVAGIFYAYKIAGAAAEKMFNLDEVTRLAQKAVDHTRTMGVALSPCILPEAGKATFTIADDEMELGMGIHGEPGIERTKLMTCDDTVSYMLDKIMRDYEYKAGDEVSVLVNGLGATPKEELYIAYRKVSQILAEKGIGIHRRYIGEFATSLEMAGISVTLFKLDGELKELLDAPAYTPFFQQFR
ncbi:MAG: dihydroxyacetone kinase subunit DhaK [Eubacteriaceae bacterium]|nr:dihydroxyacetone kinase subunit DhaK [Eubacteriaceae bacterium]